ncbi:MAG: sulfotransferase domain-containing protein [Terriglobia bacterium]
MGNLDLDTALASCNYYPVQINLCRRVIWFAGIEREMYERAGFLVPKQARMSEERYGFNLDDVLLHDLSLPIGGAPSHYIFISAFCCSTLLARLLDEVPDCLVLKEPSALGQMAMLRYRPRNSGDGASPRQLDSEWESEWQTWAALAMRLLTRTFEPGQTVIVKAADVCNTMGEVILANDPRSKAVLLSVGLRTFILSVLKLENRRVWTRKRATFWHKTLTLFPALNEVNVPDLDDAEKAAYVWLVTAALWVRFRKQADPKRLVLMDGEEVSENPGNALQSVAAFFGLPLEENRLEAILADTVLSRHAKFQGKAYDAATRRNDLADWEARFGADADRGMQWAASIQERLESDGVDLSSMAASERKEVALCRE